MNNPTKHPGSPVVITGPSGVGKGSVIKEALKLCPDLVLSISMTTRPPRPDEVEGINYFFVDADHFEQSIDNGELIEWAEVYGYHYGTPKSFLQTQFDQGLDVVMDIDLQGAAAVRSWFKDGLFIYLIPPSWEELKTRLTTRKKGAGDNLELRIEKSKSEIRFIGMFEYVVINDDLHTAASQISSIIQSNRLRFEKMRATTEAILSS